MTNRKATYFGGTEAEVRKVKKWKFVEKAYNIGQQRDIIEGLVAQGYIVKSKPIYKAVMLSIGVL